MSAFYRGKRCRQQQNLRNLTRETLIHPHQFIQPIFVVEGKNRKESIASLPGQYRYSVDQLLPYVEHLVQQQIQHVMLFGLITAKDSQGCAILKADSIICEAIRHLKKRCPEVTVWADVCFCEYTDHGHCGIIDPKTAQIDNDLTLTALQQQALLFAESGVDGIAPSGMCDGTIAALRQVLDEHGFKHTVIMGYSAKYYSGFYYPFRDAADCTPQFGNRSYYQMDYHNSREALREVGADLEEGADIIMVKPAHTYLDIISQIRHAYPDSIIAAYHVSGEYAMIKAAAQCQWLDEKQAACETLTAIKRAGADIIISYYSEQVHAWLKD